MDLHSHNTVINYEFITCKKSFIEYLHLKTCNHFKRNKYQSFVETKSEFEFIVIHNRKSYFKKTKAIAAEGGHWI